ncbi:MAG: hypothetical protein K2R98_27325 [Gemmataceae bacterium]|nr:hypothetical protein [Gemmataceae bacterium]
MKHLSIWLAGALALAWQTGVLFAADPPVNGEVPKVEGKAIPDSQPIPGAPMVPSIAGACANGACDHGCDRGRGGLIGGAAIYWIQPYFENNPAFLVSSTTQTGPGGTARTVTDRTDIRHQMDVAPQLWLGYIGDDGLGARIRWWYFRQGTEQTQSFAAATPGTEVFIVSAPAQGFSAFTDNDTPATMTVTSKLELQVWDVEAIQDVQLGCWNLLATGGLRLAHLNQRYNAFVNGNSGTSANPIQATVLSGHSFSGLGPVVALESRRPIGNSGLSLYGLIRGAVLFGSAKQNATDIFTGFGATEVNTGSDHRDRVLPVGELELGVEYGQAMGSSRVFGQVALVGQQWWGAGSASRGDPIYSLGAPNTNGSVVDSDLGFLGVAFRLGVNY